MNTDPSPLSGYASYSESVMLYFFAAAALSSTDCGHGPSTGPFDAPEAKNIRCIYKYIKPKS